MSANGTDEKHAAGDDPSETTDGSGSPEATEAVETPGTETDAGSTAVAAAPDPENTVWRGPAAWIVPALTAILGLVAVWGAVTIEAPPNVTPPGPGAFPGAVGVLLLIAAVCMSVVNLRNLGSGKGASPLAWFEGRPVLLVLAGLVVHTALLEFVGWLLAGALLFWVVAYAFGARAHLRDAIVALSMSAAVQVGFSLGLGLNLPGGFLELVL
ncbi:tripartite tricarboxylate transporter TctB family protein [Nocardiopsis sp. JB363]|uniref:tripartite tricarboxylate transporter TctB family protein n=1 Tax=Nocardiopsis sp. JB363 TaxID=1434837 RepID=UPI00097ACF2B|nr:tripartite tricarboxylate transporter TctB family protein [Nocardiopsis sp. JB363]SIO90494.1 Tricarboxylate transport protein TctB [Nocardiopsis sp. JB363]